MLSLSRMYDGPILDSHIHLWRYAEGRYPWLAEPGLEALRRDHPPAAYGERARACGITASVHVEAGRLVEESLDETRWLLEADPPAGVADRLVVKVALGEAGAERLLERQAAFERVVGVRDIVSWHPDPAKARLDTAGRMDEPLWRRNFARLRDLGLSFDLLMSPWQVESACRLAADHPETAIAVNHCGSPMDRDAEGMARWREGLRRLAERPNVAIKISDPVVYDPDWTEASLREVILTCVEAFGPARAMFGSDDPLSGLHIRLDRWVEVFQAAVAGYSAEEQAEIFWRTAARTYRMGELSALPAYADPAPARSPTRPPTRVY